MRKMIGRILRWFLESLEDPKTTPQSVEIAKMEAPVKQKEIGIGHEAITRPGFIGRGNLL